MFLPRATTTLPRTQAFRHRHNRYQHHIRETLCATNTWFSGRLANYVYMLPVLTGMLPPAALLVVLFHLKELFAVLGLPPRTLGFAALGVDLFFVISGFIMVFTTDAAPVGGMRFFKNRVARVVPIYWLITLLVFLVATTAPTLLSNTSADLLDLLRSLFFVLAHALSKLKYLHYGLAAVLAFAAVKMLLAPWFDLTPLASLAIIFAILLLTILVSLSMQQNETATP